MSPGDLVSVLDLVSVVIVTYNRWPRLLAAIDSVKAQTHPNVEIIVVNDGSPDPAYYDSERPDGVTWVDLPAENVCGMACAGHTRNAGIALARGAYVAFLDDDDEWLPEKLSTQLAAMARSGHRMSCTEAFMGDGPMVPGAKYPVYHREHFREFCVDFFERTGRTWTGRLPDVFTLDLIREHDFIITSTVLIDRALLEETGGFKCLPHGQEDDDLWVRCLEHVDCLHLNEPLVYYDGRLAKYKREAMLHRRFLRGLRRLDPRPRARVAR
jgi:glycosyltransferase involved in cell wall biosynthesis